MTETTANYGKVYSYLRFSSKKQELGSSKARQLSMSEKWTAEKGLSIENAFADLGVSAYKGKHREEGALADFLAMVKDGRIATPATLLLESLDRLSREPVETSLPFILGLVKSGIVVVTMGDGQEYRKGQLDSNKLMKSLWVLERANEESKTKSQRVGAAWQRRRDTALTTGKAPTTKQGRVSNNMPNWFKAGTTTIQIDPAKKAIVQSIFDMVESGLGLNLIAKKLNGKHLTLTGRPMMRHYIHYITHNRAVLGEYRPAKKIEGKKVFTGEIVKGYFPAVISETQFYAVQAILKARKTTTTGANKGFCNLFTGLIYIGSSKAVVYKQRDKSERQYIPALYVIV